MKDSYQNILYAFILIVVTAIFWWTKPIISYPISGIALPTQTTTNLASNPEKLVTYSHLIDPKNLIGYIRTIRHVPTKDLKDATDYPNLQMAKKLAAKIGANGILITGQGAVNSAEGFSNYILYAAALKRH